MSKTAFALAFASVFFGRCRGGPEWRAGGVERSDHDPEARRAGPVSGGGVGWLALAWALGHRGAKRP